MPGNGPFPLGDDMAEALARKGSLIAMLSFATFIDVFSIAAVLLGFLLLVMRQKPRHLSRILIGLVYVLLGRTFFSVGLEKALFPVGKAMAEQLRDPAFYRSVAR